MLLAYIDAGSGSLIFQFVIGGIVGGLFCLKLYWHKIKNFFKANDAKKSDSQNKVEK